MHLVCLGVVRRLLNFLRQGPRECKLSQRQIGEISSKLESLNETLLREFARQPRSLAVLDRWKATEVLTVLTELLTPLPDIDCCHVHTAGL